MGGATASADDEYGSDERSPVVEAPPATAAQEAEFQQADLKATALYNAQMAAQAAELAGDQVAYAQALQQFVALVGGLGTTGPTPMAAVPCPDGDCSIVVNPAASTVTRITQVAQETSFYCGPATGVMLVKGKASVSQTTMKNKMGTTTAGTGWSPGPNGSVPKALNYYLSGRDYTGTAVPSGGGTAANKTTYRKRLVSNVMSNRGIAGNVMVPKSGDRPTGYPKGKVTHHWIAIRGYSNYGAMTHWADSASAPASIVSWGPNVPKYGNLDSNVMMGLFGQRGYVW